MEEVKVRNDKIGSKTRKRMGRKSNSESKERREESTQKKKMK